MKKGISCSCENYVDDGKKKGGLTGPVLLKDRVLTLLNWDFSVEPNYLFNDFRIWIRFTCRSNVCTI